MKYNLISIAKNNGTYGSKLILLDNEVATKRLVDVYYRYWGIYPFIFEKFNYNPTYIGEVDFSLENARKYLKFLLIKNPFIEIKIINKNII